MVTVVGHDVIPGIQRRHRTHARRLLSDVQVQKSSNPS